MSDVPPSTVAVVDIGSNSTRLLIARVERGRISEELLRSTNVTRLGAGVDSDGELNEEAMQRVFETLREYRRQIDELDADRAVAVLTSAVRDATNGREFAAAVKQRYGLEPHILTGEREAQLTYRGATDDLDPDDDAPTLVIDIGGGSTELVIGRRHDVGFHSSTQAGVVRQSERHLHHDPPTRTELEQLATEVRTILADAVPETQRREVERGIAVAGTPTSLAAIAQRLEPYDPAKVHGYVLTGSERDEILKDLAAKTLKEREAVPGLHPGRAPTILPGIVILTEVMNLFGLEQVQVSEHDILRGAALTIAT